MTAKPLGKGNCLACLKSLSQREKKDDGKVCLKCRGNHCYCCGVKLDMTE